MEENDIINLKQSKRANYLFSYIPAAPEIREKQAIG